MSELLLLSVIMSCVVVVILWMWEIIFVLFVELFGFVILFVFVMCSMLLSLIVGGFIMVVL